MMGYLSIGAYLKTITTLQERRGDIDTTVFLTRHEFMMILCTGKLSEEDDRLAFYWYCFIFFGLAY
jgi:hypothetical protein